MELDDGFIVEMKIWLVPAPVPPSDHDFKYSLFYGWHGELIVGYDNERGKGDHKHIRGREYTYTFFSVRQLIDDFIAEVRGNQP